MDLTDRINAFARLGNRLLEPEFMASAISCAARDNTWFTIREIRRALKAWSVLLAKDNLEHWMARYPAIPYDGPDEILVITAGNIPLAGFHDFLSVLLTGNRFTGQLSSRDNILLPAIAGHLAGIEPEFEQLIDFTGIPGNEFDAVIATGSNNTARYFSQQYDKMPHIFRRNRNSVAILDGSENESDLEGLASDILNYYGLGCRSISQVLAPFGYGTDRLVSSLAGFRDLDPNQSYENNLDYQRARLTILNQPYTDTKKVLLAAGDNLHSPIGIVNLAYYKDGEFPGRYLTLHSDQIQCIVGHALSGYTVVPFGAAQQPALWDYADGIDTIDFLINLKNK